MKKHQLKKPFLLLLLIPILVSLVIFGCQKMSNEEKVAQSSQATRLLDENEECPPITIGELINNVPVFTGNVTKMKNALVNEWYNVLGITATSDSIYIDYDAANSKAYLIIVGHQSNGSVITAIELVVTSGNFIFVCDKMEHSCVATGDCQACTNYKDNSGNITGCQCSSGFGSCNHTIKDKCYSVYEDYNT